MTKLRIALTAATIAGWVCFVGSMLWDREITWERYARAHHCIRVDGSALWSYSPMSCQYDCAPVQVTGDTYQCDDGEWVQR